MLRHAVLERGATYHLVAGAGLKGRGGPLPSEAPDTTTFRVAPALAFEGLAQSEGYGEERTASPFDPERGLTLRFATPVRAGDVRRALRFTPAVAWPAGVEAGDAGEGVAQTFRLPFAPETDYTLTLTGLKDVFGQTLAPTTARFRTSALQPSLRVPEGVMVVEAGPNGALPLRATNVPGVLVAAERLTPATVVPRLRAYDTDHYYGEEDEATRPQPRTPTRLAALGLRPNVPGKAPLRFDSLLSAGPGGVRTGVVGFALRTPALGGEAALQVHKGLAQVTRLGLTVKHSPHESLVLVTELGTAQPIAGAKVTVRDLANRVRWTGQTGRDGRVAVPGWGRLGIASSQAWQKPIQFVFAERGEDFAFTSNLFEDGLEPWRFDVDVDWNPKPETFAGVVFSDRGLYRAGETVNLKGWLRRRTSGDWAVVQDSVRLVLLDARGRPTLDRRLRLSDLGAFDLALPIPTGAPQGTYGVTLLKARDTVSVNSYDLWQHELASGSFRVESFRTASFRVQADPAADAYVAGERFEATLSGHYLFGAAMGGAPVSYTLTQRPAGFAPEGYDGWRFGAFTPGDDAYDEGAGSTDNLYSTLLSADAALDAEGRLPLATALAPSTTGVPLELSLSATVTDPSRQQQSDETTVMLHPGLFYIGLRPRTSYLDLSRGKDLEVDVVTVDPGGVPVGARVDVELIREEWTSVREVGADGRLRWVSNRREEAKGAQSVTTAPGKLARLKMPVAAGGTYRVRATARDVRGNVVRTETYFFAAGSGYVAWRRADDDRIDLVPDRTTAYAPGETARILVQSPFEEATALVTVEREGVMSSQVVTLRGSAPQIEVPLTDAHLPNAFVSVILLTGRAASPTANADVGAPQFRVGYANLRVDAGARHLHVEVEASKAEVRPGEEVEVRLRLVDRDGRGVAGEVAFSAADAGVVDLIKYTLPDPYDSFYGPRSLAVTTTESRSVLVDQRAFGQKEEDTGGGGGDPERLRKDFRPLAFWAPSLRTGRDGRATVRFKVPERLTTLRLMASAATLDHRFGKGLGQTIVTQPLVLSPALPRFARQGDTFEAGVLVTNRTAAAGEAVVQAQANGLTLAGTPQRIQLAKGETREVRFRFNAPRAGTARIAFTGTLGAERDGLEAASPRGRARRARGQRHVRPRGRTDDDPTGRACGSDLGLRHRAPLQHGPRRAQPRHPRPRAVPLRLPRAAHERGAGVSGRARGAE